MRSFIIIILILTLVPIMSADGGNTLNMMPVPENYSLQNGKYRLTDQFTISVSGDPDSRIYRTASRILHRLAGRTGMFFSQAYITIDQNI